MLVAPYLTLLPEEAGQRAHSLREVFNGLRYIVKTGAPWRWMPNDLPPRAAVYQQAQRWLAAGCFEALAQDLRAVLRQAAGRSAEPSAAILDSRTLRSSPESGERAAYDGAKRKRGSKLHLAVDTLGHVLALRVTPPRAFHPLRGRNLGQLRPPMSTTGPRWSTWSRRCRTPPRAASRSPLPTRSEPNHMLRRWTSLVAERLRLNPIGPCASGPGKVVVPRSWSAGNGHGRRAQSREGRSPVLAAR